MVGMVFSMTDTRGDHRPVYQYDAEQQGPDECRSLLHFLRPKYTLLLNRRRLDWLWFLDTCHGVKNDLLGQKPALDVFPDHPFFINKYADR